MANASAISRKLNHHVPGLRGKFQCRQVDGDAVITFTNSHDQSHGLQWQHYIAITLRPVYRTSTWNGNSLIISDAS